MRHADAMRSQACMADHQIRTTSVLFVDLDGTLILGDTLFESFLRAFKLNPIVVMHALYWIVRGIACLKERLAMLSSINVKNLPYRPDVLDFLNRERVKGRFIVLATATNIAYASEIAEHLGVFDAVLASDGVHNLKGRTKRLAIEEFCRNHGMVSYSYVGDSLADIPIWEGAQEIFVVAPAKSLLAVLSRLGPPVKILGEPGGGTNSIHCTSNASTALGKESACIRPNHFWASTGNGIKAASYLRGLYRILRGCLCSLYFQ